MFVGLSFVRDRKPGFVTGVVTEWRAGEFIRVANNQTDRAGFRMGLRSDTVYEDGTGGALALVRE
jgi:hypothetical protein